MVSIELGEPRDTHKSDAAETFINCFTSCKDPDDCAHKIVCEKHCVATDETEEICNVGCLAPAGIILAETLEPPSKTPKTCNTFYNAPNVKSY